MASMNSDAEIEKKAACASPGDGSGEERLAGAGGTREQDAVGHPSAQAPRSARVRRKSTISESSALALSMPATSAKVTRIVSGSIRRACDLPKLPSAAHPAAGFGGTAGQQNEETDDQKGRAETEQQLGEERLAGAGRFGVDLDGLFLQRPKGSVPEARTCVAKSLVGVASVLLGG